MTGSDGLELLGKNECQKARDTVPLEVKWTHDIFMIYTEEKVKVVAASGGTELIQFLAALAILHRGDLKNRLIFTLFFNSSWCNQPNLQIVPVHNS